MEAQGHRPFVGYRPMCDVWILARPKVPYYGAYPNGFLERARPLVGASIGEPVLHVCGGMAREYPNKARGFGPSDCTLDWDLSLFPDYGLKADQIPTRRPHRWVSYKDDPLLTCAVCAMHKHEVVTSGAWECIDVMPWRAMIADPPYTEEDADHYAPGRGLMPRPNAILRSMLDAVAPGRRVGMLHYILPRPPKGATFVACVGVVVGFDNRMRCFSVFEKGAA